MNPRDVESDSCAIEYLPTMFSKIELVNRFNINDFIICGFLFLVLHLTQKPR
jgi:hypothetical protein